MLCASPNIISVKKSRKMKYVEHVALMGEMTGAYRFLTENLERKNHSKDLGVDRNEIFGYIN
jgi:hypothetical protein